MALRFLCCVGIAGAFSLSAFAGDPGVKFVENKQQWPAEFRYGAAFQGARVYLSDNRLYFVQLTTRPAGEKGPAPLATAFSEADHFHRGTTGLTTFEILFEGAAQSRPRGEDRQPTLYNYYLGNNASTWTSGARSYGGVAYEDLYEGVSLQLYSRDGLMKSDWLVSPCADASQIQLRYNGMSDVAVRDGRLVVTTCLGTITEDEPFAYQVIDGNRRPVDCRYVLREKTVSFEFPDGYDTNYELVIDPILIFSSYSGSDADNWGNTATPDGHGNLYSGGMVSNIQPNKFFPVTAGAYQLVHNGGTWDVGILKYDSVGANLLYVTYLGGEGIETPQSLVVNSHDELLILGATGSWNFPGTTPGTFRGGPDIEPVWGVHYTSGTDIFVARLSPDGTQLLSSTTLGGTQNDGINFVSGRMDPAYTKVESPLARNYGDQLRGDITVDADDNVLIASSTLSDDFPIVNADPDAAFHGGTHDAVVVKLTPDLSSIMWSRLIGGSLTDAAYSIKVGTNGRIYVAGGTTSIDLAGMNGLNPASFGDVDGWINELRPDGALILNGTYLGTLTTFGAIAYDQIYFIDIATDGDVLAYGQTQGSYPITLEKGVFSNPGAGQFIHRLDSELKTTDFSTVFGSGGYSPNISPTAFLVNECDNIYVAGWGGAINGPSYGGNYTNFVGGNTRDMPITPDAYQPVTVLGNDFYLMVLTGDAQQFVYATYLGGTTSVTHVDGGTSRFDKRGIVYHAVCAACGGNSDFPTTPNMPAWRRENQSNNCNNAAFKFDLSSLKAGIQTNNVDLSDAGISSVCMPNPFVFMNASIGGEHFEWDLGDGFKVTRTRLEQDTIRHFYKQPGTYVVKLKAIDVSTCIGVDSTYATVTVTKAAMTAGPDQKICTGTSTTLLADGAATYNWLGEKSGFTSMLQFPMVSPEEDERYFLSMTDGIACAVKDTVNVTVVPGIDLQYEMEVVYDCVERPYIKVVNKTGQADGDEFFFNFGDGTTGSSDEEIHRYEKDGLYHVALVGRKEECFYEAGEDVKVVTISIPNVITPEDSPDKNDVFKVAVGDSQILAVDLDMSLVVINKWGVRVYSSEPYADDWSAKGLDEGVYYYELKISGYPTCKGWVHVIK